MPDKLPRIAPASFNFLRDLEKNNDRDWFTGNKDKYDTARTNVITVADALIERLRTHDSIATEDGKKCLYRIYNDTRFHKDKPPYKTWFGGSIGRVKPALRGGYYFRLKPDASFIACGFFAPEPADLKRIRIDIDQDLNAWRKLLKAKKLSDTFGDILGDGVKTAPKGYAQDHPGIDLLRMKQFLFRRALTNKEVLAQDLVERMDEIYRAIRPFFDHMSEVLTTDVNGVSLLRSPRKR
ncbi:MAG: DUF2461 domain-containing protein [Flavobacteriales bacterium]|nr:DUF2461 domain-containing protein [Flavobacteriales bacterium]MBK6944684.1 DUF2461 domain-containing protein [Flavobacteriales bacterium]MBK7241168.1 DUF2461 domain-containing protein [Flavobacteriales bacterium]MBK9534339.1 DUF2461 domain-containing protein [Flavobacteriales bacterium]MBP9137239.1 DUF2461 domain-containing protein [Flavobacteriales bacterium]